MAEGAVYKEVVAITEHTNNEVSILIDEPTFAPYDNRDRQKILHNLYILALESLLRDAEIVDDSRKISISADPSHSNFIMVLRLLLSENNDFQLLAYFGGKADKNITMKSGLIHAAQVVSFLDN